MAGSSDIVTSLLRSRVVRKEVTQAPDGVRNIGGAIQPQPPGVIGAFLRNIWAIALNFKGWLVSGLLGGLSFSFSGAWSLFTSTVSFIWNFNWQATDADLDKHLESLKVRIAGQLGATLGNLTGQLLCGIAPAATIFAFNEALGLRLLMEAGEEAFDEFADNFRQLTRQVFNFLAQQQVTRLFKSARRAIKEYTKNPGSPQSRLINQLFGNGTTQMIKSWGTESGKHWSFASAVDDYFDNIKDPKEREFKEEYFEEAIEGCVEAGYVITGGIDSWILQQKQQKQTILGKEKIVEITPNREAENERIILAGKQEIIKGAIINTLNHHNLVENRDIGMWVGEPVRQNLKKEKKDRLILSIRIFWRGTAKPPWKTSKQTSCEIPMLKRAALSWEGIKAAAGGANGYMWGRFRCTANLDNNGQASIYGSTEGEAKDRLQALLSLSEAKILTLSVTEELKEGVRASSRSLYKESTRMYPAYTTILNQERILNEEDGRATLTGAYKEKRCKLPLWADEKPYYFEEVINDLLRDR